jgi:protein-S-isoprenylcysteine O-methyltransferase Ste14
MPWFPLLVASTLFVSVGITEWTAGRLCLRAVGVSWLATVAFLAATQPSLLRRRRLGPENGPVPPDWDVQILSSLRVSLLLMLAVAGWQSGRVGHPYNPTVFAVGAGILFLGTLVLWGCFYSNPFFETQVRHQSEQGQQVIQTGLYGWIRHPGYLAITMMLASLPVMLHSSAALLPWGLCLGILVARLRREENHLHAHLDGYAAYMMRVRFRLIPRLW